MAGFGSNMCARGTLNFELEITQDLSKVREEDSWKSERSRLRRNFFKVLQYGIQIEIGIRKYENAIGQCLPSVSLNLFLEARLVSTFPFPFDAIQTWKKIRFWRIPLNWKIPHTIHRYKISDVNKKGQTGVNQVRNSEIVRK